MMAEIIQDIFQPFVIGNQAIPETLVSLDFYGSIEEANRYFDNRLRSQPWTEATMEDRKKALFEASELIDRLAFKDYKTDESQMREFPRGGSSEVPISIEKATYETALKLLDGYDPDVEIDNLTAESQGFSTVRETYLRGFALEHTRAGIPSAKAWNFLKPYLTSSGKDLRMRRVD